jgi:hypothetical protein
MSRRPQVVPETSGNSGMMGQAFAILTFNAAKIAAFALIAPRGDS